MEYSYENTAKTIKKRTAITAKTTRTAKTARITQNKTRSKNKIFTPSHSMTDANIVDAKVIHPKKEYMRYYYIDAFKKSFIPIQNFEKIDIYNSFPRWLMNNTNNNTKDAVLPLNKSKINNTQLINDILYNYPTATEENIQHIIDSLQFFETCKKIWNLIKNIKYDISQHIIHTRKKDNFIFFTLDTTDYSVKMPVELYKKLCNRLSASAVASASPSVKHQFIYCLLIRYNTLDSSNQQLANNPALYKKLHTLFGIDFELFASGINSLYNNYCSLYPDLEQFIGSHGNFNTIILHSGFYVANPPFDEEIILNMVIRMFSFLENTQNGCLTFFITIPSDWKNFKGLQMIQSSTFLTMYKVIPKSKALFFNYSLHKFIKPCSVACILLQNKKSQKTYPSYHTQIEKLIHKLYLL